jgi:nucleoside-diphosphate-sugar epimerase
MNIAGGLACKSMVLAEDVAKIIIRASEIGGIYNLTDGYHPNFKELSKYIAQQLHKRVPSNIPKWMAVLMAKTGDLLGDKAPFNSYKLSKISADLTFDDSKAREELGWNPNKVLEAFKI